MLHGPFMVAGYGVTFDKGEVHIMLRVHIVVHTNVSHCERIHIHYFVSSLDKSL